MSKNQKGNISPPFFLNCDDNEKLASGNKKNNYKFVIVNFKYFDFKEFKNNV